MGMRHWFRSLALGPLLGLVGSSPAKACAVCASGDSTLTAAGTEQPFAGRLRSAVELSYRTDTLGRRGFDQARIREFRTGLSTAWAPREDVFLIAQVPLLWRHVEDATLAQNDAWGLGEMELSAKWFAFRDRAFAPHWLVAVIGGIKLPTAPWRKDSVGNYLPLEAQPGSGSLDVSFGPSLACFQGAFSAYASLRWLQPLLTRSPLQPGRSVGASIALQSQIGEQLAARIVSDLRWDQPSRESGQPDPNSGGSIAFVGTDLLLSPIPDFTALLGARLPALNRLRGAHFEGPILSVAFAQDW